VYTVKVCAGESYTKGTSSVWQSPSVMSPASSVHGRAAGGMDAGKRVTQRAPLSCYPCAKRKMRCSKTVPCTSCVRRGIPEQCLREAVILSRNLSDQQISSLARHKSNSNNNDNTYSPRDPHDNSDDHDDDPNTPRTATTIGENSIDWNHALPHTVLPIDNNNVASWVPLPTPVTTVVPATTTGTIAGTSTGTGGSGPLATEGHLTMEAANTLESLAWGSHRATVEVYHGRNRAWNIQGSLSSAQEKEVLEFHQVHAAWTHNVLHMPTFIRECQNHRQAQQTLPRAGWLSLYYSVLSVGQFYYHPLIVSIFLLLYTGTEPWLTDI
jgi:hypothetical protein